MTNGDLQSLGAMLRQAREQRALTFDEVETQTRIRVKFLQALESGDLSLLPSLAHARGFLRNYAQFLQLDANAIITQFSELTGAPTPPMTTTTAAPPPTGPAAPGATAPAFDPPPAPPPPQQLTPYPPAPTQPRTRSKYISQDQQMGPSGPAGVPSQASRPRYQTPAYGVSIPTASPEVVQQDRPRPARGGLLRSNLVTGAILGIGMIAIVVWVIVQLSTVRGEDVVPTPQTVPGTGIAESSPGPSPSFGPTLTATPEQGGPSIPLDRVLLSITVTRRTWAQIVVDGKTELSGQAEGGQVLQYQATTAISLVVGDGQAFDVTYNGQHIGPLGEAGQVVFQIFTPSGQITPTPTMTVTATETLVPSPTLRVTSTPTRQP